MNNPPSPLNSLWRDRSTFIRASRLGKLRPTHRFIKLVCISIALTAPAHGMQNDADLNNFSNSLDWETEKKCYELIEAALIGNNEKIKQLIDMGVKLDFYNEENGTALGIAISKKNFTCAKTLIAAGAPVNQPFGPDEFPPLLVAAIHGNAKCIQALIAAGANVNQKSKQNQTALMLAAAKGDLACMQMLLMAGAQVNAVDQNGEHALSISIFRVNPHCIQTLIVAGAKINLETNNGWTPLMFAIEFINDADCSSICDLLIDAMLQIPTNEQKKQMISFLGIDKYRKKLGLDSYLRHTLKKALHAMIYQQNKDNFAGSIAYQELMRIKTLPQTKGPNSQKRIADLLEKYNPGGNNSDSQSWCSFQ